MLGRSIITLDGVLEQLAPNLDLFKLLLDKMIARMKENFDLKQTLLNAGKDIFNTGTKAAKIPVLTADALAALLKGRTKINMDITGTEEPLKKIGIYVKYVMLIIIACVVFTGACILSSVDIQPKTNNGISVLAVVFFVFSISLGIYGVKKLSQKQ